MAQRMPNTPLTISAAKSLEGTVWKQGDNIREIVKVENAKHSQYDRSVVLADIYWRNQGGKVRKNPTPLTTFRTWLNKAVQVLEHSNE